MEGASDAGFAAIAFVGFGLGMLHALDADHVMAVSALASARRAWRESLSFALRWAAGHGLVLGVLVVGAVALGRAIPDAFSAWAEAFVGLWMVVLGGGVLWRLRRGDLHLHFHQHDELPPHAHWHRHDSGRRGEAHKSEHRSGHAHTPVWVGALHGAAGSAPLLALVPASQHGGVAWALLWGGAFGLGVVAAMAVFGGMVGVAVEGLQRSPDARGLRWLRVGTSLGAIALGLWLMLSSLPGLGLGLGPGPAGA